MTFRGTIDIINKRLCGNSRGSAVWRGIEVVITGLTRNRVGRSASYLRKPLIYWAFSGYLRFLKIEYLRFFYALPCICRAGAENKWRSTQVVKGPHSKCGRSRERRESSTLSSSAMSQQWEYHCLLFPLLCGMFFAYKHPAHRSSRFLLGRSVQVCVNISGG